jgi:hypothetical protein
MSLLSGSCCGSKIVNHLVVDYTKTQVGHYNLNFNQHRSSSDSLTGLLLLQYYYPVEVSLHIDSAHYQWVPSNRQVGSPSFVGSNVTSKYNGALNASGAGPFARMIVGAVREVGSSDADTLKYSLVVTVSKVIDSSIVETFPVTASLAVSPGKMKKSK